MCKNGSTKCSSTSMKYSIGTHNDFFNVSFSRFSIELRTIGANAGSNGYRIKHATKATKNEKKNHSFTSFYI